MAWAAVVPPPFYARQDVVERLQGAGRLEVSELGRDALPAREPLQDTPPAIFAYSASGRRSTSTNPRRRRLTDRGRHRLQRGGQRPVGPRGQRRKVRPLPLEAVGGSLLQRAVDPHVGLALPAPSPGVEVGVGHELPAVEEALPDVADRPLHLLLRLRPVRRAGPDPEAPVTAEAQERPVLQQPTARRASVGGVLIIAPSPLCE